MDTTRLDVFALGSGDVAVGAGRADGRDGLVHPLRHRDPADAGVDEGGGCQRGAVPVVPAAAGRAGLAARTRSGPSTASRARSWSTSRAPSRARAGASPPAMVPETMVVDHGKVYVSEHLTSVCRRMGISIQPARLRTGRDKGPVERFFRTLREELLQALPGYKGPDVHSRGRDSGGRCVLLPRRVGGDHPGVDGCGLSLPAARRVWSIRTCRGCGCPRRRCSSTAWPGPATSRCPATRTWPSSSSDRVAHDPALRRRDRPSPLQRPRAEPVPRADRARTTGQAKGGWPFQVDPDDITRVYFRDPATRGVAHAGLGARAVGWRCR